MPEIKVSSLPTTTAPDGTEVVLGVQGGVSKKMPVGAANGLATLGADGKLKPAQSATLVLPSPNGVDDTAAIQAILNSLSATVSHIKSPGGRYRISVPLLIENKRGIRFEGNGASSDLNTGTIFEWIGNATDPMWRIFGTRDSEFEHFYVHSSPTKPLAVGIQLETRTGSTITNCKFRNVHMNGTNVGGLDKGWRCVAGTGGDANNDIHQFIGCQVNNYGAAAYSFEHSQSKGHLFVGSGFVGGQRGVATSLGGGSFSAFFMFGGSNTIADFDLGSPNDAINIIGGNLESSARLLQTAGPTSAAWPITIDGVRWAITNNIAADRRAIVVQTPGPFTLRGCLLSGSLMGTEIFFNPGGSGFQFDAVGNHIRSSLTNPFTGTQPTLSVANSIDRGAGTTALPQSVSSDWALTGAAKKLVWTANGSFHAGLSLGTGSSINDILQLGINDIAFGLQHDATQGGFWRLDQRGGQPLLSFYARVAGTGSVVRVLTLDTAGKLVLESNDMQVTPAGKGLIVKSPDGLVTRRIGIDNTGAIVATVV